MINRAALLTVSLAATTLMVACGGGGGDGDAGGGGGVAATATTAEGFYSGALTNNASNSNFRLLVLEDGQFWAFYGAATPAPFKASGLVQGVAQSNTNGRYIAAGVDYTEAQTAQAVVAATYNATEKSINGSVTARSIVTGFSGSANNESSYNYNTPALLSSVAGAWVVEGSRSDSYSLTVQSNGTFSADKRQSAGCSFTGTFTPRPSSKNVYNVSLTNSSVNCVSANVMSAGVAIVVPLASGQNQLMIAAVSSGSGTLQSAVLSGVR